MEYFVAGQTSIDKTTFSDGNVNGPYLGGTAWFGYCGVRLWTDSVAPVVNIGADFYDYYGEWVNRNSVCCKHLKERYDETFVVDMVYQDSGYKQTISTLQQRIDNSFLYGLSNCRPEQLEELDDDAKGVYMFYEPINRVFWKEVGRIRDRKGFKLMWEPSLANCNAEFYTKISEILEVLRPDMFTLNNFEASAILGTDDEAEVVEKIEKMNIPFIFYRCGKRGSYVLTGGKRYFIPSIDIDNAESVDPTGCGNSSTAGALYGWLETGNPVMAAVMANISSGYNVKQFGLMDGFDDKQRSHAVELAVGSYNELMKSNPQWAAELEPDGTNVMERIIRRSEAV